MILWNETRLRRAPNDFAMANKAALYAPPSGLLVLWGSLHCILLHVIGRRALRLDQTMARVR
jgi:hypothetical protein